MAPATTKPSFRAPSQAIDGKVATGVVSAAPLVGTWTNSDAFTRDLVKIVVAPVGDGITVHAFGACTPTLCDWGAVAGLDYANSVSSRLAVAFSAQYSFAFGKVILVAHLSDNLLLVESFTRFLDGSGRNDYYSKMQMSK